MRSAVKFVLPVAATLSVIGGLYVLLVTFSPALPIPVINELPNVAKLLEQPAGSNGDRLYIPKISVDVPIVQGQTDDALEKGAWHRLPQNGSPTSGGNFVLSAHRFRMGWTPGQTRINSPFYNMHQLQPGDELVVDFAGKRYTYTVNRTYEVPPTATEIELRTPNPQLTLYTCDLRGQMRLVVEASPSA